MLTSVGTKLGLIMVPPKAPLQFVMFGMPGAGKTTLLYHLKLPDWRQEVMKVDLASMRNPDSAQKCQHCGKQKQNADDVLCPHCKTLEDNRDPGYHYEELSSRGYPKYAIWDVPGTEAMRKMWPIFYRYIQVSAVLFVVDSTPQSAKDLPLARSWIHYLFREDELHTSAFILILNKKEEEDISERKDAIYAELDTAALEQEHWDRIRFRKYEMDLSKVSPNDQTWKKILADIQSVMLCMAEY
mmetsp:Transcript_46939/g.105207  ORF Transcript_46939/g.105207 Transcript_46939/m.105207 type:complete len:242 (+) Transcript_46939:38-763(+)